MPSLQYTTASNYCAGVGEGGQLAGNIDKDFLGPPFVLELSSEKAFLFGSAGKESTCNVGDLGSIPGLGRSPGKGKGYPLQYSGLEMSMDCIGSMGSMGSQRIGHD